MDSRKIEPKATNAVMKSLIPVAYISPYISGNDKELSWCGAKLFRTIIISPKFFYYYLKFLTLKIKNRRYARHFSLLGKELYPIPPLAEQERIVAKIEKLKG